MSRPVLVIGRVGLDAFTEPGVALEEAETLNLGMGGSAANTAAGYVKLGGAASLVTCVSDDAVGRYCERQLGRYGIDRAHVRRVGGEARTSLAVYESRVAGHRNVIYRNGAADLAMRVGDVEAVDWSRFGALVVAGTVFAAEPSRGAAFHALDIARGRGLVVVFDIDYRPYSWPSAAEARSVLSRAATLADLVVGNDEEFGIVAGDVAKGLARARALAREGRTVVYKMGARGATTFAGEEEVRTGVFPTRALKPTGAGDSFLAGLLASLRDGRPLPECLVRGSACAAIVVARPGCAPAMPTAGELEAFMASQALPK